MPEAEIYAESRKEANIYAESILPGIRKADEIPLRGRKVAPRASLPDEIPSLRSGISCPPGGSDQTLTAQWSMAI